MEIQMRTSHVALAAALSAVALTACGGGNPTITPGVPTPAPSPTTKTYLFVVEHGLNQVVKVDPVNGSAAATIPVGNAPVAIALHYAQSNSDSAADYAWVANSQSNTVSEIDLSTNTVRATVPVGTDPESVAVQGYGTAIGSALLDKVYVANKGSNTVSVIDPSSHTLVKTIATDSGPFQVAQAGKILAIANSDGNLQFYDLSAEAFVTTIQVPGLAGVGTGAGLDDFIYATSGGTVMGLNGGAPPYGNDPYPSVASGVTHVSSGPDGSFVWLSNAGGQSVDVLYESSGGNTTVTGTGSSPRGVATDTFSGYTYVANSSDNTLSVYDNHYRAQPKIGLAANSNPYDVADAILPLAPTPAPTATPTAAPTSSPSTFGNLYIADNGSGSTDAFALPVGSGSKAFATVPDSLGHPYGIAENPQAGTIAVEDDGGHVNIYKTPLSNGSTPNATIPLAAPSSGMIAFDVNGNLYVANGTANVVEYSPPFSSGSVPAKTYAIGDHTMGVAFDVSGNMFVSNYGSGDIEEVSMPGGTVSATVTPPSSTSAGGLIVYNNQLYAVDESNNAIAVYNLPLSNGATPAAVYKVSGMPQSIAFDADGEMLLSNVSGASIDFYDAPFTATMTPAFSLTGLTAPEQLTIGP
jgi:YVTN family beta-propeller protein